MNLRRNMLIPAAARVLLVSSCNYLDVSDQLAVYSLHYKILHVSFWCYAAAGIG